MLEVFVGDTTEELGVKAKQYDPNAYLVNAYNARADHTGTVYTSIGDLANPQDLYSILATADKIKYIEPAKWSDNKTTVDRYSNAWYTVQYLNLVARLHSISIENFPNAQISIGVPGRVSLDPQLWIVGCSTTLGIGVDNCQRYGNIVSEALNAKTTFIAEVGASISWAGDQILRADIKPGDIIIWGLTAINRFSWFDNDKVNHVGWGFYREHPEFNKTVSVETLDCNHRLYEAILAIDKVENFVKIANARLLLIGIHANLDLSAQIANKNNFSMIHSVIWNDSYLDYGTDNRHPGPLTHKFYSEKILNKLTQLKWKL